MPNHGNEQSLCILGWMDTIERLDTLLLEARHLQQNIIYILRAPVLYRPLRFEEKTIWGEWASEIARDITETNYELDTVTDKDVTKKNYEWGARSCTVDFPLPEKALNRKIDNNNKQYQKAYKVEAQKIRTQLDEVVMQHWLQGTWTNEQQRHYHTLVAIQRLKRSLVRDRLKLVLEGIKIFKPSSQDKYALPRLLVLRAAILARIRDYIHNIGMMQRQFAKHQDAVMQDVQRPALERRREQRQYSLHLIDKCRDSLFEVRSMWEKIFNELEPINNKSTLHHNWDYHYTSRWDLFRDTVGREKANLDFISSGFFMPERSDLVSLVVHEVMHGFIEQQLDGLSEQGLSKLGGPFSKFLRNLVRLLGLFSPTSDDSPEKHLVHEIAVDILVVTTQGPAYLYALFLEIFGTDLENLFRTPDSDEIDLSLFGNLNGSSGIYDGPRTWMVRLLVLSAWVNEHSYIWANKSPQGELAYRLSSNISSLTESTIEYLDTLAPISLQTGGAWFELNKRIKRLVESTPAIAEFQKWHKIKKKSCYKKNKFNYESSLIESAQPLPSIIREYISNWATDRAETIIQKPFTLTKLFECAELPPPPPSPTDGFGSLFEDVQDIPWQSAYLIASAINSELKNNKNFPIKIGDIGIVHSRMREGYLYGLEFTLSKSEPDSINLEEVTKILLDRRLWSNNQDQKLSQDDDLCKSLTEWLGADLPCIQYSATQSGITSSKIIENVTDWESALGLIKKNILHKDPKNKASINFQQRNKLNELKELLSLWPEKVAHCGLSPLLDYLESCLSKRTHSFYKAMCTTLSATDQSNVPNEPYGLGRLSYGSVNHILQNNTANDFIQLHSRSTGNSGNYDSVGLIGRYDGMVSTPIHKQAIMNMPQFSNNHENENNVPIDQEKFIPFFSRWEVGLPFRLFEEDWDKCRKKNQQQNELKPVIAFLSLVLTKNTSRLSFVHRLLDVTKGLHHQRGLISLRNKFELGDRAFLCDGGQDILIVFSGGAERVSDIFKIQEELYRDFQIQRTETAFTSYALNALLISSSTPQKLSARVSFREVDEAGLNPQMAIHQLQKNIKNLSSHVDKKNGEYNIPCSDKDINYGHIKISNISKLPGTMDYSFQIDHVSTGTSPGKNPIVSYCLLKLFHGVQVDRIQTDILASST